MGTVHGKARSEGAMVTDLRGKSVVVAGIGPGLGRSIAVRAAEAGAKVALVARSEASTAPVEEELRGLGATSVTIHGDLTKPADCEAIARTTVEKLGTLDVVVYNAYMGGVEARFDEADLDEWRRMMDVNAFGALNLVRACLPPLRERRGSVVLINSRQIRRLGQPRGGYAMSKAALHIAGKFMAQELGEYGVRVNTVVSGWMLGPAVLDYFEQKQQATGTPVEEQIAAVASGFPLRRIPTPDDVADAVVFLASDRAQSITGQSLDVNAGESFD